MQLRPRLISPLSLAGLTASVVIVLVLLYPQQRLADQVKKSVKVDEISLQYIRNLLLTEPDNYELSLQLAQAYASIGQYENAFATLQPLYTNSQAHWREEALLIKLGILLKLAFAELPGSQARTQQMAIFRRALLASEAQFSDTNSLRQLAKLAESGAEKQMLGRIMSRLMKTSDSPIDFEESARLALANGRYLESAQYFWQARQIANDPARKTYYLKLAMSTLQSGGLGHVGLEWVQALPNSEWQSTEVLYLLTKLALASNRPALASVFAAKLVGLESPNVGSAKFNQIYYELAYTAFLGNRDLPQALNLAQAALNQQPNNAEWHERLAHISEWSGKPQLAMVHWRWLALHQGRESDWQAWMRLARDLFDYDAQIVGLERDWKRYDKSEKYAREIVQLYEYLGRPEDALTWLGNNGNEVKNPELLLLSAELLTNLGREKEALDHYRRYLSRNSASPDLAVVIAGLLQRMGLYQEAFDVLVLSQPQAKPDNELFWNNLGELAWILKQYDTAIMAYTYLSDAAEPDLNHQIRLFQAVKQKNPLLAAKVSEKYWLKTGHIELLMNAVETYASLKNWKEIQRLYRLADNPKWRDYENNLRFLSIRAEMHKNLGDYNAAEHDYQLLVRRYPGDLAVKESYLWLLVDTHKLNPLDVLMQRWAKLLPKAPNLWEVFAAGHQVLSRPNQALILYDRMVKKHEKDDLWMLNYAATLESGGQVIRAGQIRKKIWQKRLKNQKNSDWINTQANAKDIESLRLLLLNDPNLGQGVLWKLLRDGSDELKQNSQFVELAALWLNDHDQNDASRAWLIRQYAHRLNPSQ